MTTLKVPKNQFIIRQEIRIVKIPFPVQMSHKHLHIRSELFTDHQSILPRQSLSSSQTHFSFQHNFFISTSVRTQGFGPLLVCGNFWSDPVFDLPQESSRSSSSGRKRVKLEGICGLWTEEMDSKFWKGIDLTMKNSVARHWREEVEGFRPLNWSVEGALYRR